MAQNVLAQNALTGEIRALDGVHDGFRDFPAPTDSQAEPDLYLAPGFVDIQVNGFAGVDYNAPAATLQEIARSLRVIRSTGVTRFFPTVITGPRDEMVAALKNIESARTSLPDGRMIAGFHVEGPHISPQDGPRGAHRLECVRPPDFAEFEAWQEATAGNIRIVTVSPHWPQAPGYIERVVRSGVAVSIGHTHASGAQIEDAVRAGATLSTHLGNAAASLLPKLDNYIWQQLAEDRLHASFIADGIHLPAEFLRAAIRAKDPSRAILVTDASSPAGAPPGFYQLGAQPVELTADGRVVLAGQDRLAGSALLLHNAIAHVIRVASVSLRDAIRMVTVNPARATGLPDNDDRVLFRVHPIRIEIVAVST